MDAVASPDWDEYWRGLRSRRIGAAVALAASIPLWIGLRAPGLLFGFVAVFVAYWHLRRWPCPRCHEPIVGARFSTFPAHCVSCNLPIFGHVIDIEQPSSKNPLAFRLEPSRRRFVAWYQMIAGAMMMILASFARAAWWQLILMEGLAALSLAAGWWLRRDDPQGYALTRRLQLVQLVQLQSPWVSYVVMNGAAFLFVDANGGISINPAFYSKFELVWQPNLPFGVAVNLWPAMLLLVMLQARPGLPVRGEADASPPSVA